MKKILILLTLISTASFCDTAFKHEIRLGYDSVGTTSYEETEFEHRRNFEVVYEMYDEVYYNLDFGFGFIFRWESKAKDLTILGANSNDERLANSTPIYLTLKYRVPTKYFVPFVKINAGQSLNHKSEFFRESGYGPDDSFYYAYGFGFEFKNFIFDASYQTTTYELDSRNPSIDLQNEKITISLGYQYE